MIAAYTMYATEKQKPAIRAFWTAMAARCRDAGMAVPARLSWNMAEEDQWRAPNLVLAQACGYPMMKGVTGPVRIIATPSYAAPFCEGTSYCSVVVVGKDSPVTSMAQLRGQRAAVNKPTSHSGYNALRRLVADYAHQAEDADIPDLAGGLRFFSTVKETGRHRDSLMAVAKGKADVAAIDAVSFHFLGQAEPALTGAVRILTTTMPAPGLPLVTAHWRPDEEVAILRNALADVLGDRKLREALEAMAITGFGVLGRGHYERVLEMEREAQSLHYPVLQ